MQPRIIEAYDTLKEYDFILPYETAWGFIWTHLDCFIDRFRPSYNKHLLPFEQYKSNTFFYIDNLNKYLDTHLSDRTLQETGFPVITLAIINIFIIGLDDHNSDEIAWRQHSLVKMNALLKDYYSNQYYLNEVMRLTSDINDDIERDFDIQELIHCNNLNINQKFLEKYGLPTDPKYNNMVVYQLNLI